MGNGLADVLFGKVNPAGRLVQTWPQSITQLPPMMDYDIRHGRTYMYFKDSPLFPFGFGLSYTTFAWSNLKVSSDVMQAYGEVKVSVDIKNTGTMAGDEVVQVYTRFTDSKIERPARQLKAFTRVPVGKGETKTVTLNLKAEDLAYWNEKDHKFTVEPGNVELMVGSSSADIKLKKIIQVGGK
jgi:beta-glucosidase